MLHWPTTIFTVFVITIILNSSVSLETPSSLLCPSGWIYIKISDKCIKSEQKVGTRDENLKFCKNLNASMITIESAEENDEIYDKLTELHVLRFWIDGKTEGIWIDKKTTRTIQHLNSTNYTNWGNGSPSCQPGEQCCIMVNTHKFWVDIECSDDEFFACEKRRIFESSESNPIVSMEDPNSEDLECSEKLLLDMLAPKNMTKLDDTLAKMYNEIEANRAISKSISVTSSPKPSNLSTTVSPLNYSISTSSSLFSSPSSLHPSSMDPVTRYPSNESTVASSTPKPPVVTVSEELINHIIKRYQKDQLNVIRLWFELIRTHRNSSELSRQLHRSINKPNAEGFQLSNYLLVMLTVLSILILAATIISLSIITRRFLRQKTQDTYQLSSRLLELGYNAYE